MIFFRNKLTPEAFLQRVTNQVDVVSMLEKSHEKSSKAYFRRFFFLLKENKIKKKCGETFHSVSLL